MIIRHDLRLVFIHIPKCAGKQLRWIFKATEDQTVIEELWNYEYNDVVGRYVDLAHLPLSDLRHYPQFEYLDQYTVIACVRNPYMRLASAANEYYRQKSKEHEKIIKNGSITAKMKSQYYKRIQKKHDELDPRFIHSLPMHKFTHYGRKPKVDHLLRCETLKSDIELLAKNLNWPDEIKQAIPKHLSPEIPKKAKIKPTTEELMIADEIYKDDFETFGYQQNYKKISNENTYSGLAGSVRRIHRCESVEWHWGPKAEKKKGVMIPVREK